MAQSCSHANGKGILRLFLATVTRSDSRRVSIHCSPEQRSAATHHAQGLQTSDLTHLRVNPLNANVTYDRAATDKQSVVFDPSCATSDEAELRRERERERTGYEPARERDNRLRACKSERQQGPQKSEKTGDEPSELELPAYSDLADDELVGNPQLNRLYRNSYRFNRLEDCRPTHPLNEAV